nr:MAG TPA: hypothetical protein [Caudoviricetes sp.]
MTTKYPFERHNKKETLIPLLRTTPQLYYDHCIGNLEANLFHKAL